MEKIQEEVADKNLMFADTGDTKTASSCPTASSSGVSSSSKNRSWNSSSSMVGGAAEANRSKTPLKSKAHWTQAQLQAFLEQFGNKDRPQGCKDAQLRNKHQLYPCLRNCGQVFTTSEDEKEHYDMGKLSCPNHFYNRSDLDTSSLTPTPPLNTVRQAAPISMNIQQVIKMYNAKGAAVSLNKFTY